ncbi:hypothetical protein ACHQM5_026625 [Ranunculus cassubicifolius]
MSRLSYLHLLVRFILLTTVVRLTGSSQLPNPKFKKSDFVFGAGTSAYQVEGAVAEDGRTPSIWDVFTHEGYMPDKSTGDIACDGYHKYKEDVKIMSDIGLEAYRFSISWSRLIPYGRGAINPKGLEYYNNLINELVKQGIQPHVTLNHVDMPQALEEEYGGWLSPRTIEDFTAYADVCFREFGDRVSHWTTVNEPNIMAYAGYGSGQWPPRRCSKPGGVYNCKTGNSSIEPYIVVHHLLLAHASAVEVYRKKYQAKQKGSIGINVYVFWFSPLTNSTANIIATQRAKDFYIGWVVNPLVYGEYPTIMKKKVGSRLPSFTEDESKLLKGSYDFMGLNYYIHFYVKDIPQSTQPTGPGDYISDMSLETSITTEEEPPGPFQPTTVPYDPAALQSTLEYFKDHYGNPPIYIHENGFEGLYNETLDDTDRIHYISGYTESVLDAIRNGSNAIGYFVWSFLDVFELLSGYKSRFGIVHVDFEDKDLKRRPKLSAQWYSDLIKKNDIALKNMENQYSGDKLSHI